MSQAYQSFAIQQGQDIILDFTITNASGSAVDFTGATGRFAMARSTDHSAVIDSTASPQTATVTLSSSSPVDGEVLVTLTDTDTDALSGDYYFELKITDSSGNESIAARGWITVDPALT